MEILENKDEIELFTKLNLWGQASLDLLFRQKIQTNRSNIGLSGYSICEDDFVELNYIQIQAIVNKISEQFLLSGLKAGDVFALQLPNSIESQIIYLACWQQGISIAPLPILWRESDVEQALIRISPQAYICPILHDGFSFTDHMYKVGFNITSIKLLFSLGGNAIDGCSGLDEFFKFEATHDVNLLKPEDYPFVDPNSTCLISFSKDLSGNNTPLYHTHNHLVAASKIYNSLSKPTRNSKIISPFPPTCMAICAINITSWIISDASLVCYDGLMATEFQNIPLDNSILCLPATFCENKLVDALFKQNLAKLTFVQKINSNILSDQYVREDVIDVTTFDEIAFLPTLRVDNTSQIEAGNYEYKLIDNAVIDTIMLVKHQNKQDKNVWKVSCSFLPSNVIKIGNAYTSDILCSNNTGINAELNIGNMSVNYTDIERCLLGFHGVDDAAILVIEERLLGSKPVFAIVPKVGAIILHHELIEFIKNKGISTYKLPQELYKIPEIPRDYDNNIIRRTTKEKLLKQIGPLVSGVSKDGLLAVQEELASLLANS
ncbi:MAG: acyl--CoA ligase [Rhizobiales bacterium]|nr:acyl--CoA ligase [Hyphomicrobiales bacterium]